MKFVKVAKNNLHLDIVEAISSIKDTCNKAMKEAKIMADNHSEIGGTLDSDSVLFLLTEFNKKFDKLVNSYLKTTTK